ncbi:SMC-Scp complex subunit ScpB [Dermacoccus abyssi]|jgi:segregation and condensation protein B|uniref:SMC-Scp complex subunit ScpB n=1 Tax=Dermacoccus TaxID=57495 RepID=UPI00187AAC2A|nr:MULTISPECIES: SMC-Scp complex subunit ScpB [Dermacoccus]MBE7371731.1 SMC-Scp complex subunit ScpB [Dermacoccus barathri]MCT1985864.1 SMC-Scp complex subunit ScpB [Dermacoccus abyssi]
MPQEQPDRAAPRDGGEPLVVHHLPGGLRSTLEAVLMVVDEPVSVPDLASAFGVGESEIRANLEGLEVEYRAQQRGFTLREVDGSWRMYSRPVYADAVEKFLLGNQQAKLTQAALETLAVIAYRQPISRSRVGAIRGVNVDGVTRTLVTRGLITEVGSDAEGGATLYGTTPYFLQRLGIGSLDELPPLAPYLPDAAIIDELVEQGHG